jgi:hypothetical protein
VQLGLALAQRKCGSVLLEVVNMLLEVVNMLLEVVNMLHTTA